MRRQALLPASKILHFSQKMLDNSQTLLYNSEAVRVIRKRSEYAAIAQSVERILGKDEVASSNLASSSMFIQHFRCNLK